MSTHSYIRSTSVKAMVVAAAVLLSIAGSRAVAQDVSTARHQAPLTPKIELFGGYSYFYPHAVVTGTLPGGIVPVSSCLCAIPAGFGVSAGYNFNRWLGITGDFSDHIDSQAPTQSQEISRSSFLNGSIGPRFTYRSRHFVPFAEFLVGVNRLSPQLFMPDTRFGIVTGGGLDWNVGHHFGIRLVQADYVVSNHQFGSVAAVAPTDVRGLRLQAGVVFAFGGRPHNVPASSLQAAQQAIFAPAPIIAPTVVAIAAPTIVCTAMPSMMNAGESSMITSVGTGSGPLVYGFKSDTGFIEGAESSAILNTAGAMPGSALVTCTVMDSAGQTAFATTTVRLAAVPKPVVVASALCSISFARDMKRPTRVNNEAKACLDDVALELQRSSDSRLVLVGSAAAAEHHRKEMADRRAANTKAYFVEDKGIDPSRITASSSSTDSKTVSIILVPMGATMNSVANVPFDETVVNPQPRSSRRVSPTH